MYVGVWVDGVHGQMLRVGTRSRDESTRTEAPEAEQQAQHGGAQQHDDAPPRLCGHPARQQRLVQGVAALEGEAAQSPDMGRLCM